MKTLLCAAFAASMMLAAPLVAQGVPGAADVSRVAAGTYAADPNHTQVVWSVEHLGFSILSGMFGQPTGTLVLDPAHPDQATLSVEFPINKVVTTRDAFTTHLLSAQILDAAAFPTATFRATGVAVSGQNAKISGTLTLHGVTKPVVVEARFIGAGVNPTDKKETIGFEGLTTIKRSDFGIGYALPIVSDTVTLRIAAAFEKAG